MVMRVSDEKQYASQYTATLGRRLGTLIAERPRFGDIEEAWITSADLTNMSPLSPKWTGPVCFVTGMVMLAVQVYAYLDAGLLSSLLIGCGIGLSLVGAGAWFYYLDDKRSGAQSTSDKELPTVDEYERQIEEVEPDDTEARR